MPNVKISNLSAVWSSSAVEFDGLKLNITNAASSGSSNLLNFQLDGSTQFKVGRFGIVSGSGFSGSYYGSLTGTSSVAMMAISSSRSEVTFMADTSSLAISANSSISSSVALSANNSLSSSTSVSSSFASSANNSVSSSFAVSSSRSENTLSSSYAISCSYAPGSQGGTTLSSGSSYNITSSWAISASYAPNPVGGTTLGSGSSYNITSSWASYANTASYAIRYSPNWPSNVEISGSGFISNQTNTVNYVATSASFTLFASSLGSGSLHYKWYINSSSCLQSGSSNSLLIETASKENRSGYYTCVVTNSFGTSTSPNFLVQVLDPAVISGETIPTQTPSINSLVSFGVTATGDNLNFSWKKQSSNSRCEDGTPSILNNGSRTANMTIQALSPQAEDSYYCEVSNSISLVTSSHMTIYLLAPQIVTQPSNLSNVGTSVVVATGSAISYSWEYNGSAITNQTASTLNLDTAVQGGHFTQYMMNQNKTLRCRVYNSVGSNYSDSITVKPFKKSDELVTGGGTETRATCDEVAGDATSQIIYPYGTTFTWVRNGSPVGSDVNWFGHSIPKLTLQNIQSVAGGTYICSASYNGLSVTSDSATLTVNDNTQNHNLSPTSIYIFSDETVTIYADEKTNLRTTFGDPALPGSYRTDFAWRSPTYGSSSFGGTYVSALVSCPNSAQLSNEDLYPLISHTVSGSKITGSAQSWSAQRMDVSLLSSCPTNASELGSPWNDTSLDGTWSGDPSAATTFTVIQTINFFKMHPAGVVSQPTTSQSVALGNPKTISVVATGSNLHYMWFLNGVAIPDSDSNVYSIAAASYADSGSYVCLIGNKSTYGYRTTTTSASRLDVY